MKYKPGITSIGSYVPQKILTNIYLEDNYETTREWIEKKIGADNRHIADASEAASDLAYKAARECLRKLDPGIKIDCIIVSTTSPDYKWIPTASVVAASLEMEEVPSFDVREGCAGCLHAIDNAVTLVQAGIYKRVLVIASEVLSRFMNYKDRMMPAFFGDGASAIIIENVNAMSSGIEYSYLDCDDSIYDSLIVRTGASAEYYDRSNYNEDDIYWKMNGKDIFQYAVKSFGRIAKKLHRDTNFSFSDIDKFIIHQANKNIIEENFRIHNIPLNKAYFTIGKFGNTGSSSVFLCLNDAVEKSFISQGDRVALISFGAGGNFGITILIWGDNKEGVYEKIHDRL